MNGNDRVRITVLVENNARGAGILGEHGLAVWIETGGHRLLFDTGQGMALEPNAERIGIDLASADAIVLSHGHYDHVGGLEWVLGQAPDAELHLHPQATEAKFSGSAGARRAHRVTIPFVEREEFAVPGRRVVTTREAHEVVPGVWATGEIPRTTDFEDTGGPFFLDEAMTRPDPLLDDQALFIPSPDGLIVIFGCAHAGVVNTLRHIEELVGKDRPVRLLLGGLHLLQASARRMDETITELAAREPERMVFCHCTGSQAVCRLEREFPGACLNGHAGMVLEIGEETSRPPKSSARSAP